MDAYIRGGVLEDFGITVESLGGNAAALLDMADVAPEVLTVRGIFLPFANYMKLLHCAAVELGLPHFGLLMARRGTAETLGTVGLIMTQADTVGAAWQTLADLYRIHDTFGQVRAYQYPESMMVSYGMPGNHLPGARQVHDVAAGMTINIMRQFCGSGFRADEIILPYDEPEDLAPFAHLPAERISFGSNAMEVHMKASYLRQKLRGNSDELRSVLGQYFSSGTGRTPLTTSRLVEDIIRRFLPSGECTLPRVADTLCMTPRTLQAKLESESSSFRDILSEVRRQIATYHLRRGDMPMTQLALILGYSELSAFSRSFRNWYGQSPRQWVAGSGWVGA